MEICPLRLIPYPRSVVQLAATNFSHSSSMYLFPGDKLGPIIHLQITQPTRRTVLLTGRDAHRKLPRQSPIQEGD